MNDIHSAKIQWFVVAFNVGRQWIGFALSYSLKLSVTATY